MKKSYDYFKTLKEMSECVGESFSNAVGKKDFKKETIVFSGLKTELSENLMNEFVAPIERNDIYKLSFCLNDELRQISDLIDFIMLADTNSFSFSGQIGDLFIKQTAVFFALGDFKSAVRTVRLIRESCAGCNRVKKQIVNEAKVSLQNANAPLLNYEICCMFSELLKSVEKTFCEAERVLINNS